MLQNISRELGYEEEINSTSAKEYLKVIKFCDNIIFEGFEPKL